VGTSTNLPGPRSGAWTVPHQQLTRWLVDLEGETADPKNADARSFVSEKIIPKTQDIARRYLDALSQTLRDKPNAFGIRESMIDAGGRLIDTLDELRSGRLERPPAVSSDPQEQASSFIQMMVAEIAGTGNLTMDAVIRNAAIICADELLRTPGSPGGSDLGGQSVTGLPISDELFCIVFKIFFKESVAGFITTMIAGKIQIAMPLLHLIDPAGQIAHWVGEQVVAHIPDPCEKGARLGEGTSLADLARGLVNESVDRALGIEPDVPGTAAA
jgi:hypothetical protein